MNEHFCACGDFRQALISLTSCPPHHKVACGNCKATTPSYPTVAEAWAEFDRRYRSSLMFGYSKYDAIEDILVIRECPYDIGDSYSHIRTISWDLNICEYIDKNYSRVMGLIIPNFRKNREDIMKFLSEIGYDLDPDRFAIPFEELVEEEPESKVVFVGEPLFVDDDFVCKICNGDNIRIIRNEDKQYQISCPHCGESQEGWYPEYDICLRSWHIIHCRMVS